MRTVFRVAKQGLVCVLCFAFLLSICCIGTSAASVYVRPQKHIYLVLDDSGSMNGQPEHDANYALQTLVAMTDKTDTINIYFLNNSSKIDGELDLANKSDALINTIKVDYPGTAGSTPYTAVAKAQKDLKKAVEADDQGEYWLIVVTDGGFTYPQMDYGQDLVDFASTQLKNNKYPQVMTVSINGCSVITGDGRNKDNVFCIENADVIPSMNEAARAISDRVEVTNYTLSSDGKTLDFSTPYPAGNIIVLAQNTQTAIANYTCNSKLNTSEKYKVAHPTPTAQLDTSTVCFITEVTGSSIASGPISLEFTEPLQSDKLVIFVEPAIGLVARYYNQDGTECDPSQLKVGETAKVIFGICDPATQQPIDESLLDGGVTYSLDINGQHYDGNEIDFKVDDSELFIDMFAEFSDGFVLDIKNHYSGLIQNRILSLTLSDGGNFTEDINQLSDDDYITATVRVDGFPLSVDEFNASTFEIRGGNFFTSRFKVVPDPGVGTYTIYPKGGFLKIFTPQVMEFDVVFTTPLNEEDTGRLTVELTGRRNWIPFIVAIAGLAVLIYLIWVYSVKAKFPLDIMLFLYPIFQYDEPIDFVADVTKPKTLFSWGVLDWKSVLPHPGPFVINLRAIDPSYGDIRLVARGHGQAFVTNVQEVHGPVINALIPPPVMPEYRITNEQKSFFVGYAEQGDNPEAQGRYGRVLILDSINRCLIESPFSNNASKKFLRYIRRKDWKAFNNTNFNF